MLLLLLVLLIKVILYDSCYLEISYKSISIYYLYFYLFISISIYLYLSYISICLIFIISHSDFLNHMAHYLRNLLAPNPPMWGKLGKLLI